MKQINTKLLMEDELLYSYVVRVADANGFSVNEFALDYIYPDNIKRHKTHTFLLEI